MGYRPLESWTVPMTDLLGAATAAEMVELMVQTTEHYLMWVE